jgi:hypothetical protein
VERAPPALPVTLLWMSLLLSEPLRVAYFLTALDGWAALRADAGSTELDRGCFPRGVGTAFIRSGAMKKTQNKCTHQARRTKTLAVHVTEPMGSPECCLFLLLSFSPPERNICLRLSVVHSSLASLIEKSVCASVTVEVPRGGTR